MKKLFFFFLLFIIGYIFTLKRAKISIYVGPFRGYILALQYSTFRSPKSKEFPNLLTIHGLWISNFTLNENECVNPFYENYDFKSHFRKTLEDSWPSFKKKLTNSNFWELEYNRHGFCISYYIYRDDLPEWYVAFTYKKYTELNVRNVINEIFVKNRGSTKTLTKLKISLGELYNLISQKTNYRFSFRIICSRIEEELFFSEVYFYFDKMFIPAFYGEKIKYRSACRKMSDIISIMIK